jgi:hypothetical protein
MKTIGTVVIEGMQIFKENQLTIRDVEKRPALQPMIPSQPRDQDDAKLAGVQEGSAVIPARS